MTSTISTGWPRRNPIGWLILLLCAGCTSQPEDADHLDWYAAEKEKTAESYQKYLDRHPKGTFARYDKRNVLFRDLAVAADKGQPCPRAASYPRGPGVHRLVTCVSEREWESQFPEKWLAPSVEDVELVVLISHGTMHVGSHLYTANTGAATSVPSSRSYVSVRLVEARTGKVIAATKLVGGHAPVPEYFRPGNGVEDLKGKPVELIDVQNWLAPYVEVRETEGRFSETRLEGTLTEAIRSKIHEFQMSAGSTYFIDLESADFETRLKLLDAEGKSLAENDRISPTTYHHARIVYTPTVDGNYQLEASSHGHGGYTLRVGQFVK